MKKFVQIICVIAGVLIIGQLTFALVPVDKASQNDKKQPERRETLLNKDKKEKVKSNTETKDREKEKRQKQEKEEQEGR